MDLCTFVFEVLSGIKEIFEVVGFPVTLMVSIFAAWQAWKGRMEAAKREKMENEEITIALRSDHYGQILRLPYKTRRKHLTRGEIAGIIGMFAGGRRYNIPGLSKVFYNGRFDDILSGKSNFLLIEEVTEEEFDLFCKEVQKA